MKKMKTLAAFSAASLFMANHAYAAGTWSEARSDAMGGTGVASASYGSGVLTNPALLAKAKQDDTVTVILPSVSAQITDKDNLQDQIDDISDKVDQYKNVIDDLTLQDILLNPNGSLSQFQGAAGDLAGGGRLSVHLPRLCQRYFRPVAAATGHPPAADPVSGHPPGPTQRPRHYLLQWFVSCRAP